MIKNTRFTETLNTYGFVPAWIIGGISSFCRFFEVLVSAYVIFNLSESALLVALNSGLRVAPLLAVGSIIGKYSDKFDKKKYMNYVLDRFKMSGFEPQTFAKDRAIYQDLYIFISDYK